MNINIGDEGYLVKYIQSFLQEYYSNSVRITGTYDDETHECVIGYMNLPDTRTILEAEKYVSELVGYVHEGIAPFEFLEYFKHTNGSDNIVYKCKFEEENKEIESAMIGARQLFYELIDSIGWEVYNYDFYIAPYTISIRSNSKKTIFPKEELVCMLNLFTNQFIYNKAIIDGTGYEDMVHTNLSGNYKITMIEAKPNTTYLISHGGKYSSTIVVGSSLTNMDNVEDYPLSNVVTKLVNSGTAMKYTTSENCQTLVIQVRHIGLESLDPDPGGIIDEDKPDSENINRILIIKGDYQDDMMIPIESFPSDPWMLHDKLVDFFLDMGINKYSKDVNIEYVQKIIMAMYRNIYIPGSMGIYDDELKKIIKNLQIDNKIAFATGYVDAETEYYLDKFSENNEVNPYE